MAKKTKPGMMPSSGGTERKQRTRQHVIANLSSNYVEHLVFKCGYTVQRSGADYGYDLWLETYDETGQVEDDFVRLQLKASDSLRQYELAQDEAFSYPVSTKDCRLWSEALLPVFFILYDA